MDTKPKRPIIGLAAIPKGKRFHCGGCEYYNSTDGKCHNKEKQLNLRDVDRDWCCDYFECKGMKVIVG